MIALRTPLFAALAATAALALGAPAAGATTAPGTSRLQATPIGVPSIPGAGLGGCGIITGDGIQGRAGGTATQVCVGAGLSLIGPSIGQIATVNGPTIVSPAFGGISIASVGNVAIGL